MNLLHIILRQWRQRPARTLLSVLSVAIGVAAVMGVTLAQSSVRLGYRKLLAAVEGHAALEVAAADGSRFSQSEAERIETIEGADESFAIVTRATLARVQRKRFRAVLLGFDPSSETAWSVLPVISGDRCEREDEALMSADLAESLQLKVGDRLVVLARRGPRSARIVGLVDSAALAELSPAASLVMPLPAVQQFFELGARVDRVRILLGSDTDRDRMRGLLERGLPADLIVQAPVDRSELGNTIIRSLELALEFAGALTMAMAVFIVLNTLRMNFGERRRDIAIIRVLGVTTKQLATLHVLEGVALGVAGSLLGIPLGIAMGRALAEVTRSLLAADVPSAAIPLWTIPVALVVGPLVAAAAALLPALQSRHVSPSEALGDPSAGGAVRERFPLATILIGSCLWAVATALLFGVASERLSAQAALPAGVLMLVGFIAMIPGVLGPLVRGLARLIAPWMNLESSFAADQLLGRRTRTGLTIGVLVVAVNAGVGMGNAIINNVNDVRGWYRRVLAGDLLLSGPKVEERQSDAGQPSSVRERVTSVTGVDYVVETRYFSTRANGLPALCVVHEFDPRVELPWTASADEHARMRRELAAGRAVIGSVLARKLQMVPGGTLRLELEGRSISVQVAAVVRDYTLGGLGVYLDRAPAADLITLGPAETYTVTLKAGTELEGVMNELKGLVGGEGLVVSSYAQLRGELNLLIDGVVAALWALIAVGFVIGGIAVANTLTMSVLEQTRELGLLRIVGMTRVQVRRLVACESLLLGLLGALMGSIAGLTTAWIIHLCSGPLLGQSAPFEFHAWLLFVNLAGCLLTTVVAAWSPGWRAARMNLLEAIAFE